MRFGCELLLAGGNGRRSSVSGPVAHGALHGVAASAPVPRTASLYFKTVGDANSGVWCVSETSPSPFFVGVMCVCVCGRRLSVGVSLCWVGLVAVVREGGA